MTNKTFEQTLREIGYGALADELTDAVNQITAAVSSPGKKAKLTLTLALHSKSNGQVIVTDDVKVALPKEERQEHIMYLTPENNLTARDPRQRELEGMQVVKTNNTAGIGGVTSVDVARSVPVATVQVGNGAPVTMVGQAAQPGA